MKVEQAGLQSAVSFTSQSQRPVQEPQAAKQGGEFAEKSNLNISQLSKTERDALPVSEQFLIKSIEQANKAVMGANTRFEFSIHDKTKEIIVKVFDKDTGELIRDIPSEKILDIVSGTIC